MFPRAQKLDLADVRRRFKKSMNRAGTTVSGLAKQPHWSLTDSRDILQLLQKTGQIERTVDREFTDEEVKYKSYVR